MSSAPAHTEKPRRGLGRGLDALFADSEHMGEVRQEKGESLAPETGNFAPPITSLSSGGAPRTLPTSALIPAPYQPRRFFDMAEMRALLNSIKTHGVLQPLLVRASSEKPGKYEIIAGERRWRAAQLAQLHDVPVIVQNLDNRGALEIALIENIQRADLTPIEEAEGYQRLMDEFGHTQDTLADVVGKSRSNMSNILRLLALPKDVREMVHGGEISAGHARQLIGIDHAEAVAKTIVRRKLSVRQTERLIARIKRAGGVVPARSGLNAKKILAEAAQTMVQKHADVVALEAEMSNLLGLRVEILYGEGGGTAKIQFSNLDQLDDLLAKLSRTVKG